MQPPKHSRQVTTAYRAVARNAEHVLNVLTAGRLNYWRNQRVVEESGLFSGEFYRSHYGQFIPRGMPPLKHYLTRPWNAPFDPSPDFDSAWYLRAYPEVAYRRYHPLVDYVRRGRERGRLPRSNERASLEQLQIALSEQATARLKCLLDSEGKAAIHTSDKPEVSILLLLHNRAELTLLCLESIVAASREMALEVVIIDNASTDATQAMLERVSGVRIFRNEENSGFGPAGNQAAELARGEFLLFLNNDTQLLPGAIEAALRTFRSSEKIGAVGAKVLLLDGRLQEAGSVVWRDGIAMGLGRGLSAEDPAAVFRKEVDFCSACFLLTTRQLFEEVGGFHSRYAPSYFEDCDFCLALWEQGKKVIYEPTAALVHFESASIKSRKELLELSRRNEAKFAEAHKALLQKRPKVLTLNWRLARFVAPGAELRQRILYIDDFPPLPFFGSGLGRANTMVAAMVHAGYEVTIAHTSPRVFEWRDIYAHLDRSIEVTPALQADFPEFLQERAPFYRHIVVSRPNNLYLVVQALEAIPPGAELQRQPWPRVVYDAEALYGERQRLLAELQERDGSAKSATSWAPDAELDLAERADVILSVSTREAAVFRDATAKPVQVVGFSLEEAPTPQRWQERNTILFVGSLHATDHPNYDSLVWFFREVVPLLPEEVTRDARMVVAGYRAEGIPPLESGRLAVDWLGPQEDLTPLYDAARVFIAPTRFAAGMPYKCLEAASLGVPMVVTELLRKQLDWQEGRELLVADDRQPADFAAAIGRLYRNEQLWLQLRKGALARVAADFAPRVFQQQVEAVFPRVRDLSAAELAVG